MSSAETSTRDVVREMDGGSPLADGTLPNQGDDSRAESSSSSEAIVVETDAPLAPPGFQAPCGETTLAVSPRDPRHVRVSAACAFRNDTSGPNTRVGVVTFTSRDSGKTFQQALLPQDDSLLFWMNSQVVFDDQGTAWGTTLTQKPYRTPLYQARFEDNKPSAETVVQADTFPRGDHPSLAVDRQADSPHHGSLYIAVTSSSYLRVYRFAPDGSSWQAVGQIAKGADSSTVMSMQIEVVPRGDVALFYRETTNRQSADLVEFDYKVAISTDGGDHWDKGSTALTLRYGNYALPTVGKVVPQGGAWGTTAT